jgi:pimeloyl-ACP methyl ester carboxylesterase
MKKELIVILSILFVFSTGTNTRNKDIFCNDPDCGKNVTQLILSKGYPAQEYIVTTLRDQYLLGIQRIVKTGTKGVVLLQHGLLDASHTWVLNFPTQSLGFLLADAGYDVWLGNVRGNTYARACLKHKPTEPAFWDFTFDDFIEDDLPSVISFILNTTKQSKLFYIGHSQGTMMGFGGYADPNLASKIRLFVALAPVAYVANIEASLLKYLANFNADELLIFLGQTEFGGSTPFLENLLSLLCEIDTNLCSTSMCAVMGCDPQNWNNTRWPVYAHHDPAGTSVKNIIHFAQLVRQNKFQKFDYGTTGNMKHYNQKTPPQYPLANLKANVALFSGTQDYLADPNDFHRMVSELPQDKVVFKKNVDYYSHIDFIWGSDAPTTIYNDIIQLFSKY